MPDHDHVDTADYFDGAGDEHYPGAHDDYVRACREHYHAPTEHDVDDAGSDHDDRSNDHASTGGNDYGSGYQHHARGDSDDGRSRPDVDDDPLAEVPRRVGVSQAAAASGADWQTTPVHG